MKKLTLTFCALFVVFAVAPALFADDGPEKYSGKEKEVMQPAPPVCEWYRAHEWDLDIWGAFVFAQDTGHFDVPNNDPFFPDEDVTLTTIVGTTVTVTEPKIFNPRERVDLGRWSQNALIGRDNTWGGGVDLKYFWSKYFGAGIEGLGIAAKTNFAGAELATLTFRYPWGRFAPYAWGGIGAVEGGAQLDRFFNEIPTQPGANDRHEEFFTTDPVKNHHTRALAQFGAGLEYRLTCHIGLMADFSWNVVFGKEHNEDKFHLITEQGTETVVTNGVVTSTTVIINTAEAFRPSLGSEDQNFGMVRFGVTFSY